MTFKWQSIVSSLLTIACTATLQGEDNKAIAGKGYFPPPKEDPPADNVCGNSKRPMRVTARHIESNGIGYNQGYTTLEGFFSPLSPWGDCEQWVPFLDVRGHAFNDGRLAANAGLGLRYITNYVWGINAYYDYRDTHHQHYNQFAAGLEALGKIWDFRINGYLPLGRRNSKYYHTKFDKFEDHYLYLSRKKEVSMKGANAEVGFHIDHFKDFPFYIAGGPYYLNGTGRTAWGGQLRARVDIFDYLTLEGNVSYDHLFRWVGQGQVGVNMPLGTRRQIKKSSDRSCTNSMALSTRALQRVDRFEIIPVDTKRFREKAINPVTGDPYYFLFVDNTSHSLGTFESPFPTLMEAQLASWSNDVIMVFVGDGTTKGMDSGITLKDGQRLWGSVVSHVLPTTVGHIKVPILQSGNWVGSEGNASFALLPIISNSTGNVVTIGNNNYISGIYIQNNDGNGIVTPTTRAVANLTVDRCTIQGDGGFGFDLTDLGGTLLVQSNDFTPADGSGAMLLTNTAASLNAVVLNNSFAGYGYGIEWFLENNVQGTLTFNGNQMAVYDDYPFYVDQTGTSSFVATASGNNIICESYGIYHVMASSSNSTWDFSGNMLTAGGYPIYIDQTAGTFTGIFIGNQIISTDGDEAFYLTAAGTNATYTIAENTIYTESNAVYIDQTNGSLTALIADNVMTSTGSEGFYWTAAGSSGTLTLSGNTIVSEEEAIYIDHTAGTLTATIDSNTLTTFDDDQAVYVDVSGTATTNNLVFANNTVNASYSSDGGIFLETASVSANAYWQVLNNTFTALNAPAAYVFADLGSVCLTFNNNVAYPIQYLGVGTYQFYQTAGTFTYNPLRGNTGQFFLSGDVVQGSCQ